MKRVLADAAAFGLQYLRSRVGTFFALAFPIILILLFGSIFSGGESSPIPLHVQDLDGTNRSGAFIDALNSTGIVEIRTIPSDVPILDYIRDESLSIALRIPSGFEAAVEQNLPVNVTLYADPTQSTYGVAYAAVAGAATAFNFQLAQAQPVVGVGPPETITAQSFEYIDFFLPGMIGFTALTTPLFGMTNVCAEYRTRRFFKLLATTKLTKADWLAGKVLFNIVLMLVSVGLMVFVGRLVFQMQAIVTPVAILFILAGTLEFTSLGMVLGIFVRDAETAAAVANAIGFPMMFLAGTFFPIDAMPPFLQSVARLLPLTFMNDGLRATMVFGNEAEALFNLLVTVGIALAFFVVAAKALSWKTK